MNLSKGNTAIGVSERAIENWLANASERSYQTAFCHLLNSMGYSVVHSTTHGPGEEGKDVIAKDPKGKVIAFQLKRGDINVAIWRQIYSQITELIECRVRHPSIGRRAKHYPTLITTGYINEHVNSRIDNMNRSLRQRRHNELKTWAGSELLMKFKEHTGGFLPQPIPEFHRLLGFMINEGNGPLDKDEFDLLLRSILPFSENPNKIKKNDAARAITASAVIAEYALAGFDQAKNHFAKIEAYTMLFCYIRAIAVRLKLPEKYWMSTVKLIERAVDICARQMSEEAEHLEGFGQGSPFTEPVIAPYRKGLIVGAMATHGLWCMLGGRSDWYGKKKDILIKNVLACSHRVMMPAESFVPARFLTSEFLRHNGHIRESNAIFADLLKHSVLRKQVNKAVKPLWGPYLSVEEAILRDLGKQEETLVQERWELTSHTAHAIILAAAARLFRQDLELLWHPITSLHLTEFVPDQDYRRLMWKNKHGLLVQKMMGRPQS